MTTTDQWTCPCGSQEYTEYLNHCGMWRKCKCGRVESVKREG
jgi:hypothetical protein